MLKLQSAPAVGVLTDADAKTHAVIGFTDDDAYINGLVLAASDYVEAQNGILGRALITQTWTLTLPAAPTGRLCLPFPPLQSVSAITYESSGTQTFDPSNYRVISDGDEGFVELVDGASWPTTDSRSDAFSVTFIAGYGDAPSDVPAGIRQAVRLLVAHWYNQREAATEKPFSALPMGVQMLLAPHRIARGLV